MRAARSYYALWGILLATYAALAVPHLWSHVRTARALSPKPFASTDGYMDAIVEVPDGSRHWLDVLRAIPATGTIVLFCPKDNVGSTFLAGILSYLSWPRDFQKEEINPEDASAKLSSLDRNSTAAVLFCRLPPPEGLTRGWRFGSGLVVVGHNELK